jgi:hypothetical protein
MAFAPWASCPDRVPMSEGTHGAKVAAPNRLPHVRR